MRPELNHVFTRCLQDSAYLGRFLADPAGAASELGVDLTSGEIAQISDSQAGAQGLVAGRFARHDTWC